MFNRDPVDKMIEMLQESFPENLSNDNRRSLAIRAGSKGQLKGGGYTEPSPALETDYLKHFIFFPLRPVWSISWCKGAFHDGNRKSAVGHRRYTIKSTLAATGSEK